MLYMYLLPLACPEYQGFTITGKAVDEDHVVDIAAGAVYERFINSVRSLIQRKRGPGACDQDAEPGRVPLLRYHIGRLPRAGRGN